MSVEDMDLDLDFGEEEEEEKEDTLIRQIIDFCGGPDLIEVFGGSGSGKTKFSVEVLKSLLNSTNKKALFIDTEKNIGDPDEIEGADYVYIPDWHDLYTYVTGEGYIEDDSFGENTTNSNTLEQGYDMIVLDSIGFPALIQYGKYRVADDADQFKVFNELQVITGDLKKYAQLNDSLVIVTNQPKSDLTGEENPDPFGDKAIYGFKEVWKTIKQSSSEVKTRCVMESFRSRQVGDGKNIFRIEIDSSGTDVEMVAYEDVEGSEWTQ